VCSSTLCQEQATTEQKLGHSGAKKMDTRLLKEIDHLVWCGSNACTALVAKTQDLFKTLFNFMGRQFVCDMGLGAGLI